MNRNIISISLLSLSLCACSGTNNKQAEGEFDYANKSQAKELVIPKNLKEPKRDKKYFITSNINKAGSVGEKLDIRGPSLVLPVAAASRTETNLAEAKIWFDQVIDDEKLEPFIIASLKEKLATVDVEFNTISKEEKTYESGWFNKEKISGFWGFESVESSESIRFRYQLETKPHGRSVAVSVFLIDFMKTDEAGGSKTMDLIDKQRAEMKMLNEFISFVGYKYKAINKERRLKRSNQKLVAMGLNVENEPAYIVEMEFDALWSNMPTFFEKNGFKVKDLNKSKNIYYVEFVKPDNSFWSQIWGDDKTSIDLLDANYQFVLRKIGTQTSVTIYNNKGVVLSEDLLNKIYTNMAEGLSFKN